MTLTCNLSRRLAQARRKYLLFIPALVMLSTLAGCRGERRRGAENPIRSYVKAPLDKADVVKEQLEERDRKMREAAGE